MESAGLSFNTSISVIAGSSAIAYITSPRVGLFQSSAPFFHI